MTEENLLSCFSNSDFILKTQQQIHKDFAKLNLEFRENFIFETWDVCDVERAIEENIVILVQLGESKLLQLLYTIDLPEREFLSLVQDAAFFQKLAKAILRREARKVYYREKFG
jgi:hypothetical protein